MHELSDHYSFGKWGEDVAVNFLLERGYEILARNWRHEHKEIDIIAQKDNTLYFVEVKTRHGEEWKAEDAVTSKKRALMWRAMMAWKVQHPSPMPVRYPVIAIVIHESGIPPEIRWHDNVWDI